MPRNHISGSFLWSRGDVTQAESQLQSVQRVGGWVGVWVGASVGGCGWGGAGVTKSRWVGEWVDTRAKWEGHEEVGWWMDKGAGR